MNLRERVGSWPRWGQIGAAIGLVASVLGILGFVFQMIDVVSGSEKSKQRFDAAYKRAWSRMGSEFMSSHNYLTSVIPSNIVQTKDRDHWERVSYSWAKHMGRMNDFYNELATCLENGDCEAGETKAKVCNSALAAFASHQKIHSRMERVEGINIDYTGGNSPLGSAFGPSISVPNSRNLQIVVELGCV